MSGTLGKLEFWDFFGFYAIQVYGCGLISYPQWSFIAGFCWFAALGVYGQGAALLGEIGPVIGWPILLGLSLIISNYWAYNAGEWNNAKKPFNKLLIGLFVLIISAVVLGLGNSV